MTDGTGGIRVRIIGASTVVPGAEQDTACALLNGRILIDTGWNAAINMVRYGEDPLQVDWVFITHCHHDHYLGLPHLLFYDSMRRRQRKEKPPLVIVGPKPDIGMTVDRALHFLQHDRFPDVPSVLPQVIALQAGAEYEAGGLQVRTAPAVHPVVGLCYRFDDPITGASMAMTGDTAFHEPLARHVAGVNLLIHEASHGPVAVDPLAYGGHSGAVDAARIAAAAKVERLVLVHYPRNRAAETLAAARKVFDNTVLGNEGDPFELG